MTIELKHICVLLMLHFIGDFLLQPNWVAKDKNSNPIALIIHGCLYSLPFAFHIMIFDMQYNMTWGFIFLNSGIHIIVDFITSKFTSYFHKKEMRSAFFDTIGFDQMAHMIIMFALFAASISLQSS